MFSSCPFDDSQFARCLIESTDYKTGSAASILMNVSTDYLFISMKPGCISSLVQAILTVLVISAIGRLPFMPCWKDGKDCAPLDITTYWHKSV